MTVLEIPLSAQAQTFQITLSGRAYRLAVTWREPYGWFLDIARVDGTALINGIPLVTGVDLLVQYAYLGIAGKLVVLSDGDPFAAPTFANLGTQAHLYYVTDDA